MDFSQVPQQREVHSGFPGNASPTADAPWSVIAFPAHQHPQSAHSSYRRTVSVQPHGYAGRVVRDTVPPPVENIAAHGQPQDLRYVGYDMANDHPGPPPHEHRDHTINNYVGVALDVPARAQAAPPAPEINIFDDPDRNAAADPARPLPDEWPPPGQGPLPNRQVNEVLRQLAILYLREPNSQVAAIRMEPSHAHGIRVVITLELADL